MSNVDYISDLYLNDVVWIKNQQANFAQWCIDNMPTVLMKLSWLHEFHWIEILGLPWEAMNLIQEMLAEEIEH